MSLIEFSVQMNASDNDLRVWTRKYHLFLNRIFYLNDDLNDYFNNLEFFSIIFRISGEAKDRDFNGGSGPEFLKKVRGEQIYTIDLTVPVSAWKDKNEQQLRQYLADGVCQCFELLKEKARKAKEIIDEEKLDNDFQAGMQRFMTEPLPELKK